MRGVATDIEIHAKEMAKTKESINRIISEQTGKPFEQVEKDTDRDYWLSAAEAIEYGLVSKIVASRSELKK
jgi:ATP-dependent clp protease proteolytic subunit 2